MVNRQAWRELGKISSDEAKKKFISFLEESCPLFKPFIEAHQKEREERQRLKNSQPNGSLSSRSLVVKGPISFDQSNGEANNLDQPFSSLTKQYRLTEEQR